MTVSRSLMIAFASLSLIGCSNLEPGDEPGEVSRGAHRPLAGRHHRADRPRPVDR